MLYNDAEKFGISFIDATSAMRRNKANTSIHHNIEYYSDIWKRFDQFVEPDGTVRTDAEIETYIREKNKKHTTKIL